MNTLTGRCLKRVFAKTRNTANLMTVPNSALVTFLRAVHRRFVLARALERAGICAGIAAGFALFFTVAMLWRGDNGLSLAVGTILLGGAIGLFWGLALRPAIKDAALAADQQLELSDLLATALSLVSSEDPWARAVVAVAEQRCRALSPNEIIVRKLGGRAWGGIGLAAALVLTLGALSALPGESPASPEANGAQRGHPEFPTEARASSTVARGGVLADRASRSPGEPAAESPEMTPAEAGADAGSVATFPHGTDPAVAGTGAESGRTQTHSDVQATLSASATVGEGSAVGGLATGGGGTDGAAEHASGVAGTHAAAQAASQGAIPWQSPSWESQRQAAQRAVEAGQVHATYRDVVREYFRVGDR